MSSSEIEPKIPLNDTLDVETSEDLLVNQAIKGNQKAFGALSKKYYQEVLNYCCRRFPKYSEFREDFTQEIFLRAFSKIGDYKNMGIPFRAWLFTIAHNAVLKRIQYMSIRNDLEVSDDGGDGDDDYEGDFIKLRRNSRSTVDPVVKEVFEIERNAIMERAIAQLPERQRIVVQLKLHYAKMKNVDIAEILGKDEKGNDTSVDGVKSLYWRSLQKLKELLAGLIDKDDLNL